MQISEIFHSVQGESVYSGLPCVFVRLSGCNLKCSYCDTKYAENTAYELSAGEVFGQIDAFKHVKVAQITGGEPLLQKEVYELFDILKYNGFLTLLETNGSMDLKYMPDHVCKIVDVKTPSSGFGESFLIGNLKHINPERDNLKFVIGDINDYEWMKEFLSKNKVFGQHVLVSTVFSRIEPKTVVDRILKDGLDVRFQLQLHKYIDVK